MTQLNVQHNIIQTNHCPLLETAQLLNG